MTTAARLPARLRGAILLAASGGATFAYRAIYDQARQGPPELVEFGLALTTFVLASTGLLLLIHGARLFGASPQHRPGPADTAFDTRAGAAMMQARHARRAMRRRQPAPAAAALDGDRGAWGWRRS